MDNYLQNTENADGERKYDYTPAGLVDFTMDSLSILQKKSRYRLLTKRDLAVILIDTINDFAENSNDSGFKRTAQSLCSYISQINAECRLAEQAPVIGTGEFESFEARVCNEIKSFLGVTNGSN